MERVIKHVLNVGIGNIKTNNKGNELKSIIINDKTYRYDKDKALTKTLLKTLSKIEKSNKYRATKILNQASDKNKVRSALKKYAITQKATITEEQSAFNSYVNSYSISNINMKGLRGLSYLKYQEDRLKQFLNNNTGMKILVQVDVVRKNKDDDEEDMKVLKNFINAEDIIKFRSRRYEVLNTEDITGVLNKIADMDPPYLPDFPITYKKPKADNGSK